MNGFDVNDLDNIQDDSWVNSSSGNNFSNQPRYSVSNPPQFPASAAKRKGNGKTKRGQKLPNKIQQLPPMDNHSRELAEKKIEELHKLANTSKQILDTVQTGGVSLKSTMPLSYPNGGSTISGSEADFLARQIQSSDLSLLQNAEDFQTIAKGMGMQHSQTEQYLPNHSQTSYPSMTSGSTSSSTVNLHHSNTAPAMLNNHQVVIDALRDKIMTLEKQVTHSSTMLQKREQELEKKDLKLRAMVTEIEQLKREHTNDHKKAQNDVSIFFPYPFLSFLYSYLCLYFRFIYFPLA